MIELADVIGQLRDELDKARCLAGDAELQFELGPIDLEVTVGLEKTGQGGAKIRFWVIELGGEAGATSQSTQRIKLTLNPTLRTPGPDGQPQKPYVSGDEIVGER
jgi:hypothetical protein